jgi:hypothetical protein
MNIERWHQFSLAEQMGNIGSEISRAYFFEQNQDSQQRTKALERTLELVSLTIDDKRYLGRLKELCRLQELIADLYSQSGIYSVTLADLLNYFMPFAVLARK